MPLPKIDLPIHELNLPSTGEKVRYRAFTVKEEKLMLIAKESNDTAQIVLAVHQVLNNCLIDKTIDDLAVFDIEYLLVLIRSKSINNVIDFVINDPETDEEIKLKLDLDTIKVIKSDGHTNKIKLNNDYTIFMKYPGFDLFSVFSDEEKIKDPLVYYDVMVSCIDKVVSEETVYKFSDFSKKEIDDFMDDLNGDVIENIKTFFDTMPVLRHEIKYTNNTGKEMTFVIEGTESFFI